MLFKIVPTLSLLLVGSVHSFAPSIVAHPKTCPMVLNAKKSADEVVSKPSLSVGTFVEFEEKKHRVHIGKIADVEHKSNGGTRYCVVDDDGHKFHIAEKAVHFSILPPNSPGPANQLYREFVEAQRASADELQSKLDISPDLLELAWEESLASEEASGEHAGLTPDGLIELVHSHAASTIEKYQAWRLLQSDIAHVFFKDMKDHGRITSFKVKARKTVDLAKQAFCNSHTDSDLCLV